jgi:hypothetical protein
MRVTIYQPQYFPRLHYFNRILDADIFVILDSTQYTKSLVHFDNDQKKRHKSYQADTPIQFSQGTYLLTIPIKHQGLLALNKTQIDYTHHWAPKHVSTLRSAYGKAPFFNVFFPQIKEILSKQYQSLAELNMNTILWGLSCALGFDVAVEDLSLELINRKLKQNKVGLSKILCDRETGVKRPDGFRKGTEWTTAICQSLGATEYLHGGTAQSGYMESDYYNMYGITPIIQNWKCQEYHQQFRDRLGFIPNLSIVDLLFNAGQERTQQILLEK